MGIGGIRTFSRLTQDRLVVSRISGEFQNLLSRYSSSSTLTSSVLVSEVFKQIQHLKTRKIIRQLF